MHDASPTSASPLSVIEGTQTDGAAAVAPDLSRPRVALTDVIAGTAARSGLLTVVDGPILRVEHAVRSTPPAVLDRTAHAELDVVLRSGVAQWLSPAQVASLGDALGPHVLAIPVLEAGTCVGGALLGYDEPVAFSTADREFLVRAFTARAATSPLSVADAA